MYIHVNLHWRLKIPEGYDTTIFKPGQDFCEIWYHNLQNLDVWMEHWSQNHIYIYTYIYIYIYIQINICIDNVHYCTCGLKIEEWRFLRGMVPQSGCPDDPQSRELLIKVDLFVSPVDWRLKIAEFWRVFPRTFIPWVKTTQWITYYIHIYIYICILYTNYHLERASAFKFYYAWLFKNDGFYCSKE